ncbi:MAG TPA: hypothetical protein PKI17_04520, partial [Syntrophomonas sp.]|nr:hypothetical protein [Syntrophomonas sp.]
FYGSRLHEPLGGIYAIAHDLLEELATEAKFWTDSINGSGLDFWLITRALCWNKQICELDMGARPQFCNLEQNSVEFNEMIRAIFDCLCRDNALWQQERLITKVVDILNHNKAHQFGSAELDPADIRLELEKYYQKSADTIKSSLSEENYQQLLDFMAGSEEYQLSDAEWVAGIYKMFINYAFGEENLQNDMINAATALFNAKIAACALEMNTFSQSLIAMDISPRENFLQFKLESVRNQLIEEFGRKKVALSNQWMGRSEQTAPPLVPFGYMEYIPGRPIVVPKKISGKDKHIVNTDELFKQLRKRYEDRFNNFLATGMALPAQAKSDQIIAATERFMVNAEKVVDELFPGDLSEPAGLEQFVSELFKMVPHQQMFTVNADLLKEMLIRFPPVNLMIPLGFYSPADLLGKIDPRDAFTYANLVESWSYNDRDILWLTEQLKPESFAWTEIKPLIVDSSLPEGLWTHTKISNLNRITARITIKAMEKGKGGRFPKLRYFTSIIRRICLAEH